MSAQISQIISGMTLSQKIGQLLIFGWQGENEQENTTVSRHARILLEEFEVGGVILLGRNVGTPDRTARTMNELQERSRLPLFIIADQEGGMVARFKDPFVVFPSNMAIGATDNPSHAFQAARATAEQLRAVGVNFNFAPCVDVNNNPLNPIIGTRSYGDNPQIVARFAAEAIRGYHGGGVLTSVKHFPGHGDTSVDSHLALPTVDFPRERMESMELPPFHAAIASGVATIMTTHILFPALDPDLPATMSHRILTGLLREEMGYSGVIVTDCLEMKGVAEKWGTAEAALGCIKAGADCPLICHTLETQRQAQTRIRQAVETGELSMERLEESVRRVLELKRRFGILAGQSPAVPEKALEVVSSPDKQELALNIARKAVTVIRDRDGIIPAQLRPTDRILVVSLHPTVQALAGEFHALHPNTGIVELGEPDAAWQATSTAVKYPGVIEGQEPPRTVTPAQYPKPTPDTALIVIATCPSEPWTAGTDVNAQAALVKHLLGLDIPVVVVALREPYDIRLFPDVPTYVASYGYRPQSLRAIAEVILGASPAEGVLPVSLAFAGNG